MDAFFRRFFPNDYDVVTAFHARLKELLPAEGAVLDLGCGDHRQLAPYRTPKRQVWGTDFSTHPRLADTAWFRPLRSSGEIPFPARSFDLVASAWVLEHVMAPVRFLREVNRVLRPGGNFLALTCNGRHYVTWINRLLHGLPHAVTQRLVERLYGRAPHDTHPAHFRLNTPRQLRRAANRTGLRIAEIRPWANADYFAFCTPLCHAAVLADWMLERILPGMGRLYMMVTLEKPRKPTGDNPWVAHGSRAHRKPTWLWQSSGGACIRAQDR